jgi:hypothetical protein
MRRIALLVLPLALTGCGYHTWYNLPFTGGHNPNAPVGASENMQRVTGHAIATEPLTPEAGDIWPGPLPPAPTLRDLEQQMPMSSQAPEQPVPGSPISRGAQTMPDNAPQPSPQPTHGSSTPPRSNQPALNLPPPPATGYGQPAAPPAGRNPAGQVYQLPGGPAVTNGGGAGYQTTTTPNGGSAIIVPNGNGTSTVIHSDGRIETVPTPK